MYEKKCVSSAATVTSVGHSRATPGEAAVSGLLGPLLHVQHIEDSGVTKFEPIYA